jgi:hypothetical protein
MGNQNQELANVQSSNHAWHAYQKHKKVSGTNGTVVIVRYFMCSVYAIRPWHLFDFATWFIGPWSTHLSEEYCRSLTHDDRFSHFAASANN